MPVSAPVERSKKVRAVAKQSPARDAPTAMARPSVVVLFIVPWAETGFRVRITSQFVGRLSQTRSNTGTMSVATQTDTGC